MSALTIKSVKSLKNSAVWQDYKDGTAANSLARKTLIYGFNGTGKTTLSRVFDSMREGALVENLPLETEFEITLSDGQVVSSKSFTKPLGNNLLVFNSDFVNRNFKWDESRATPIFYLSEENISKKEEYDAAKTALDTALAANQAAKETNDKAIKEHKDAKTKIARRVRDLALSGSYSQAYDAKKIEKGYAEREYTDADILEEEALSEKQAFLNQSEPLPKLDALANVDFNLNEWTKTLATLLKVKISSDVVKQFEEHAEALNWIGHGLDYHTEHELKDCLFCGNEFSDDRKTLLESLFNAGLKEQQTNVDTALSDCESFINSLRGLYSQIPKENDIQASQRHRFLESSEQFKEIVTKAGNLLNSLKTSIKNKKANLIEEIDITTELAGANISDWNNDFLEKLETINAIITSHNSAFDSFKTLQETAFVSIRNHIFSQENADWKLKCASLSASETTLIAAKSAMVTHKTATDKLDNELRKQGVAANKVSDLLKSYLGHGDVKLAFVDDGYQLIRADGKPANNLSEGEKTGLAFCFFLTQFEAEGRNKKELVVVIDDPISSLDTAAKTHAFSLMRKMTKKCAQTIILTHNMGFMNMVKREFRNRNSEGASGLLQIQCQGSGETSRKSSLCQMNKLLADYDTEYHYLFEIVFDADKNKASDFQFLLPNATRKMLEMFVAFAAPTQNSFAGALGESGVTLVENNLKSLERLVQIESHGTMDGMDNLPALTVEEAIKACSAAMEFIKKRDPKHYKAMKKMCEAE